MGLRLEKERIGMAGGASAWSDKLTAVKIKQPPGVTLWTQGKTGHNFPLTCMPTWGEQNQREYCVLIIQERITLSCDLALPVFRHMKHNNAANIFSRKGSLPLKAWRQFSMAYRSSGCPICPYSGL